MKKLRSLRDKITKTMMGIIKDESGMELLQIVILCLIAVIVGGLLVTFFSDAFTEIGGLMVEKIKTIFNL